MQRSHVGRNVGEPGREGCHVPLGEDTGLDNEANEEIMISCLSK